MSASTLSLESLPNEILQTIVSIFDAESVFDKEPSSSSHHGLEDATNSSIFLHNVPSYVERYILKALDLRAPICNLALVSKHLNSIAAPILYNKFAQLGFRSLPAFLKQLLAGPALRGSVKRIIFNGGVLRDFPTKMKHFTKSEWEGCSRIITDNHLATGNGVLDWRAAVQKGYWDPISALLLCQTPALQELTLLRHGKYHTKYLHNVLYSAAECLLPSLRSVSLHFWDDEGSFKLRHIVPFLRLESLEKFYVDRLAMETNAIDEVFLGEVFAPPEARTLSNQTFNAKELYLDQCNINADKLITFLGCFKSSTIELPL